MKKNRPSPILLVRFRERNGRPFSLDEEMVLLKWCRDYFEYIWLEEIKCLNVDLAEALMLALEDLIEQKKKQKQLLENAVKVR